MKTQNNKRNRSFQNLIRFTLLMLSISTSAFAQGSSTHGGDIVACFKSESIVQTILKRIELNRKTGQNVDPIRADGLSQLESVKLFDFHRVRNGRTLGQSASNNTMIEDTKSYAEILKEREENLKNTNYVLWKDFYLPASRLLPLENWFEFDHGVAEVDDSADEIKLDANCLRIQIANQVHIGSYVHINFDKRFFDRLSSIDKAGLISHEWFYSALIQKMNAKDSLVARSLNVIFYQKGFKPEGAAEAANAIKKILGMSEYGIHCTLNDECFYLDREHQSYTLNLKTSGVFPRAPGVRGSKNFYTFESPFLFRGFRFNRVEVKDDLILGNLDPSSFPQGVGQKNSVELRFNADGAVAEYKIKVVEAITVEGVRFSSISADSNGSASVSMNALGKITSASGGFFAEDRNQRVECQTAKFYHADAGATIRECNAGSILFLRDGSRDLIQGPSFTIQNLEWQGTVYFSESGAIDFVKTAPEAQLSPVRGWRRFGLDVTTAEFESCGANCLKLKSASFVEPQSFQIVVKDDGFTYLELKAKRVRFTDNRLSGIEVSENLSVFAHSTDFKGGNKFYDQSLDLRVGSWIEIYPNGRLKALDLKRAWQTYNKRYTRGLHQF